MKPKVFLPQYHTERVEVFGKRTPTFLCTTLLSVGMVGVDILAFEVWFEGLNGAVPDGISLAQAVKEKYGERAEQFIRRWL